MYIVCGPLTNTNLAFQILFFNNASGCAHSFSLCICRCVLNNLECDLRSVNNYLMHRGLQTSKIIMIQQKLRKFPDMLPQNKAMIGQIQLRKVIFAVVPNRWEISFHISRISDLCLRAPHADIDIHYRYRYNGCISAVICCYCR